MEKKEGIRRLRMQQKFEKDEIENSMENQMENKEELSGGNKIVSIIKECILYGLIIIFCIYVMPQHVIQRTIITGSSMENTLQDQDNVLVEKFFFGLSDPKRFDIVVFYPYGEEEEDYYVKRVIALPGETIQIIGEDIYINGEHLEENFGKQAITYQGIAEEPLTLGNDEYFLMGDNREVSFDSRYEEIGAVHRDSIDGKALIRIWPFSEFGKID